MKIKDGYMLRSIAGYSVVVPIGDSTLDFNGVINLNETGTTLWKALENDATEEDLVKALLAEYDVDNERALTDVRSFVKKMLEAGLIEY